MAPIVPIPTRFKNVRLFIMKLLVRAVDRPDIDPALSQNSSPTFSVPTAPENNHLGLDNVELDYLVRRNKTSQGSQGAVNCV